MTVKDMIERLQSYNVPNAVVVAWDADCEDYQPVSGFVYNGQELSIETDQSE